MLRQQKKPSMNYELEKTQTQLAAAQERLELALEASELSLWDWDLLEQQVYHTRTEEILGLTTEQGQSMLLDLRPLVHPDDLKDLRKAMVGHLKGHTQEYYAEYRMRHADGHWVWIEDRGRVVERDEQGRALRMLGTRRDITKRLQNDEVLSAAQANSKKVKYLSEYDALTGLANRELFQQRLNESIAYSHDKTNRFALLHLDLDRFKVLNESLGVESADQLLVQVSRRLNDIFSQANTVARLSGNEFAIILRQYGSFASLRRLAELTLERISRPIELVDKSLIITTSIGISLMPEHAIEAGDLLTQASMALKQAKYHGGNTVEFYHERMQASALERLELEQQLRYAIANGELCAHYQPKVDLLTQKISSVEALVRWNHPELGLVSPAVFIPIAEETGLIKAITEQVLEQACNHAKHWKQHGYPVAVSVNLSVHHVRQGNILGLVVKTLEQTGLPAHLLELELTENHLLDNAESVIEEFTRLRELGVRLAIDDFGTGFSSLNYLKVFPADTIKIDQAFIQGVATNNADAQITKAVISMAHNLNIKVVAEGIETREQLDFLTQSACDEVQGYFVSRPIPAEQMLKLLQSFRYKDLIA